MGSCLGREAPLFFSGFFSSMSRSTTTYIFSTTAVHYLSIYQYAPFLVRLIIFTIHATTSHLHSFYSGSLSLFTDSQSPTHGYCIVFTSSSLQSRPDAAPFFLLTVIHYIHFHVPSLSSHFSPFPFPFLSLPPFLPSLLSLLSEPRILRHV